MAQQVQAIFNALRTQQDFFKFPGDETPVSLDRATGLFITMNPGLSSLRLETIRTSFQVVPLLLSPSVDDARDSFMFHFPQVTLVVRSCLRTLRRSSAQSR